MIKATATTPTGPIVILGLTGENITRLAAGEPILITGSELSAITNGAITAPIAIVYGRDNDAIRADLDQHFTTLQELHDGTPQ